MGNLIFFFFDVDSENSEKIRVLLKRSRVLGDPQELSGLLNLILAIIILNLIPRQAPQKKFSSTSQAENSSNRKVIAYNLSITFEPGST